MKQRLLLIRGIFKKFRFDTDFAIRHFDQYSGRGTSLCCERVRRRTDTEYWGGDATIRNKDTAKCERYVKPGFGRGRRFVPAATTSLSVMPVLAALVVAVLVAMPGAAWAATNLNNSGSEVCAHRISRKPNQEYSRK